MKTYLCFLLLFIGLTVLAQNKAGQEPYLTKSLSGEAVKNVESETSGGNITVSGVNASAARVDVYVNRNDNRKGDGKLTKEEIQKRLDADYELTVAVSNGTVIAKAKPRHKNMDWKRALSISFSIYVPQTVSSDLSTSGGNIELTNLSGDQRFKTSGGNLQLENISGKVKGGTSGGNIALKRSKDDITLSTSGGNIEATDCTGNLNLNTSGGSIKLARLNGVIDATTSGGNVEGENIQGDLSAHTSGGNLELSNLTCSLDASTSGGHIEVALNELRKSIKISNSGGNISLQLPKGANADLDLHGSKLNIEKLDAFSGKIEDDQVRGKLNGGGTSVVVNASSGNVSLSFK